ncbi:MAG: exo-alpha-sialidase [Chitinophagaceae bacterium]|nr:exo-alpha-sialidase [Chitinophagaceae bacterium]MCW5927301.1 exo-alpha-sialidase [Chitinophagaceae bacterium]
MWGCSTKYAVGKNIADSIERVLILPRGPNNPRNSEGDFITLKSGRILYVYSRYTGDSYMDDAPAFLAGRYSDDGGKTWSSEDLRIVEQEGRLNVMSVSLLRLKNGEIALFYLRKNSLQDCMPMVRFSSDEGETWTSPRECITDRKGYFILHNDRVIQLKNGRLVFAVAFSRKICSYYSDDNGRTWISSSIMPNPDNVVTQEPGIIELKNGHIMMIMRTDTTTQYVSYSTDNGASWSSAQYSNIVSASQSPASIARMPNSGDLLLVWNDNQTTEKAKKAKRTPLNIAVSKDEGKTWIYKKVIEGNPDGSFCYTAIHFTKDRILLAYFDWATLQITITSVDTRWIYKS